MAFKDYIVSDKSICGGQPVIRGTRVTLRTVLASLADGDSIEEILQAFPTLSNEAVRAVIAYAASSAEEDLPLPPVPVAA
ncbi:MAG: hypothetical protein RLZZ408_1856 [Verrucomicrobiota bacterium]|jgi:hypothetical protein